MDKRKTIHDAYNSVYAIRITAQNLHTLLQSSDQLTDEQMSLLQSSLVSIVDETTTLNTKLDQIIKA